jgi:hypothetical protein
VCLKSAPTVGSRSAVGADRSISCFSPSPSPMSLGGCRNDSLHHLYSLERQKIEDDFKKGRDLVRQRLLDGVEERRRKIREDKESVGDVVAGELVRSGTSNREQC